MRHHVPSRNSRNFDSKQTTSRRQELFDAVHGFLEKPRRGDHLRIYLKRQVVNILEAKNLDILLLVKDVVGILTKYLFTIKNTVSFKG